MPLPTPTPAASHTTASRTTHLCPLTAGLNSARVRADSTKPGHRGQDGHFLVRLARSWLGHLGAFLDRDFASPGLLGVREDDPAGGSTWGVRPAEPRPGFRSRAYVSGPSAGRGAKVAPMMQGGVKYHTRPGGGACYAPPSGRKNGFHTVLGAEI